MTTHTATPTTRQFTVRHLLLLTTLVAVCLLPVAQLGVSGIFPAICLGTIGMLLLRKRYVLAGGLFGLVALCALLLLPAVSRCGPAPPRIACLNNMRQIALAILIYECANGHLPPPYTTDSNGNPLHSWRVLILPYLEQHELYDAIDLTKPWYHPDNLALATRMPDVYRCPSFKPKPGVADVTTAYVAILGDHTAWPRSGLHQIRDVVDGPSETVAVVESEMYRLHWMSTADPGIEMIGPVNADGDTLVSHGPHNGLSGCAFVDGHVQVLSGDFDFNELRALMMINDGEIPKSTD